MEKYITAIESFWQSRDHLSKEHSLFSEAKNIIEDVINLLELGKIAVCQKQNTNWVINEWIKKAILLNFKISESQIYNSGDMQWYDKIAPRFIHANEKEFQKGLFRIVPGAFIRKGSYLGEKVVVMPSFINIGAYVGNGTLVDSWATIGSCAYVGKNCHISGGTGIGGVLEPIQARPVIIEDNCFIGARSEIVEGTIVEEGSVISMGVFIGASTKIVNRNSGEIIYGRVPAYSVVVPGFMPSEKPKTPGLACAVIIKQVDRKTREKTSINELLREV